MLVLYYILFLRFFFFRSLKFNPKIVTSFRSHGKWGDLVICILPISWCLNILSNSTTLLKLLEWQSESNFFTLRVRGKQWYWVYKFDFKSLIDNIYTDKLYNCIGYTSLFTKNTLNCKQNLYILFNGFLKTKHSNTFLGLLAELIQLKQNTSYVHNGVVLDTNLNKTLFSQNFYFNYTPTFLTNFYTSSHIKRLVTFNLIGSPVVNSSTSDYIINKSSRDIFFPTNSLTLIKSINTITFISDDLLKFRYNYNTLKPFNNNFYIVLKQKPISDWLKFEKSSNFSINTKYTNFLTFYSDSFIFNDFDKIQFYNNMRLLRLNKMLFLPTNLQIAIITNSFDVIHSWFIPGLGLKMDCVPGRSTHHTLYIDIPGIYYGQCAEICGRFHHHMPIKVCALELEHYLLWFNHYILSTIVEFDLDKFNSKILANFSKII